MKILNYYVMVFFFKRLCIVFGAIAVSIFLIDVMNLMQSRPLYDAAFIAVQQNYFTVQGFFPIVILIAAVASYGALSRRKLILAIMSLGGTKRNVLLPMFFVVFLVYFAHIIVLMPFTRHNMGCDLGKSSIWLRDHGVVVSVESVLDVVPPVYKNVRLIYPESNKIIYIARVVANHQWVAQDAAIVYNKDERGVQQDFKIDAPIKHVDVMNALGKSSNIISLVKFIKGADVLCFELSRCKSNFAKQILGFFISTMMIILAYNFVATPQYNNKLRISVPIFIGFALHVVIDSCISVAISYYRLEIAILLACFCLLLCNCSLILLKKSR